MADWATHLIVPLLVLLLITKKENIRYVFFLLPLAVAPDFDTFLIEHRSLLHNIFVPAIFFALALAYPDRRAIYSIAATYLGSHVLLDLFAGGVVLFYPFYSKMAFVDAELLYNPDAGVSWIFRYGWKVYTSEWTRGNGHIADSVSIAALLFVMLAFICLKYRDPGFRRKN